PILMMSLGLYFLSLLLLHLSLTQIMQRTNNELALSLPPILSTAMAFFAFYSPTISYYLPDYEASSCTIPSAFIVSGALLVFLGWSIMAISKVNKQYREQLQMIRDTIYDWTEAESIYSHMNGYQDEGEGGTGEGRGRGKVDAFRVECV